MNYARVVTFRSKSPRRNLPKILASKRGESNFVLAFERAYVAAYCRSRKLSWRDFALAGYGIADIVMLSWATGQHGGRSLTLEKLRRERLTAFELKLTHWRSAVMQAHRYRYFCDRAIVVVPKTPGATAAKHVEIFRELGIGLWSFDQPKGSIRKYYTPPTGRAKSAVARERAIRAILAKVQLCKSLKTV
jgi:hypothetical protein